MTSNSNNLNPNIPEPVVQGSVPVINNLPPEPQVQPVTPSVAQAQSQPVNTVPSFQPPTQPYSRPKSISFIKTAFFVLVLAILGVAGYFGYQKYAGNKSSQDNENVAVTPTEVLSETPTVTQQVTQSPDSTVPPTTNDSENEETIDFAKCSPGDGYSRSVDFGSTYLSVVEVDAINNICNVEILNEVEGGYTKYGCSIPRTVGSVTFTLGQAGSDFSEIMSYCVESKPSNSL